MRVGDLVINRYEPDSLTYQIKKFDGDKVILEVIDLPLVTVLPADCLVKISSSRKRPFKLVKREKN